MEEKETILTTDEEVTEEVAESETSEVENIAPDELTTEETETAEPCEEDLILEEEPVTEETQDEKTEPEQGSAADRKGKKARGKLVAVCAALLLVVVLAAIFIPGLTGTKKSQNAVVMTVDGTEIYQDEYDYYLWYMIDYYGSENFADEESFDYLKEYVTGYLTEHYALYKWANEYGFEITDEDKEEIAAELEEVRAQYDTEEDFETALQSNHLTEDLYIHMCCVDDTISDFYEFLYDTENSPYSCTDEEALLQEEELGIYAAKHILFMIGETDEENAEILAKAEATLARINAGEDFDTLMNELSEDSGLESYPDGYTFGYGEMVDEFYEGTAALEKGQVSGIITTDYGYHIIKRIDPDMDELKTRCINDVVNAEYDLRVEEAEVSYSKAYDNIVYTNYVTVTETDTESEE